MRSATRIRGLLLAGLAAVVGLAPVACTGSDEPAPPGNPTSTGAPAPDAPATSAAGGGRTRHRQPLRRALGLVPVRAVHPVPEQNLRLGHLPRVVLV